DLWKAARTPPEQELQLRRLHKALVTYAESHRLAFEINEELDIYRKPAERFVTDGKLKFVLMGHTHLLKRVGLGNDTYYLNTGTWADIMRFPREIFGAYNAATAEVLRTFLDDLTANRLDKYREFNPCVAYI